MEIILAILSLVMTVILGVGIWKEDKLEKAREIKGYQEQVVKCKIEKNLIQGEHYQVEPEPLSYDTTLRFEGSAIGHDGKSICTISNARERVNYLREQIKLGHIRVPVFAKCEISQLYVDFVVLADNSADSTLAQEMKTLSDTILGLVFGLDSIDVGHAIELLEQANDLLDRAETQNRNQSWLTGWFFKVASSLKHFNIV